MGLSSKNSNCKPTKLLASCCNRQVVPEIVRQRSLPSKTMADMGGFALLLVACLSMTLGMRALRMQRIDAMVHS